MINKALKTIIGIFLLASLLSTTACDEMPAFEGIYIGTYTVEYSADGIDVPATGDIVLTLYRNFKDINNEYEFYSRISLEGRIDDQGNYSVTRETTTNEGNVIITIDEGKIDYEAGLLQSTLTEYMDDVEIIRLTTVMQKQFIDIND